LERLLAMVSSESSWAFIPDTADQSARSMVIAPVND
jgi:hypothetical protein